MSGDLFSVVNIHMKE